MGLLAELVADVASGWPAATGVEADQFHAEFVEVSVAVRVLFIEIPPAMSDKTLAVYPTKIVSCPDACQSCSKTFRQPAPIDMEVLSGDITRRV